MATYEGNSSNNTYSGGSGNDNIDGGAGNDLLSGGSGNDRVEGDSGNDTLYGGLGNDTLDGGSGNDRIWGDEGDDRIEGDSSDDTIYGGLGNDRIDGGSGLDRLFGDDGNDQIEGSGGDDSLYGGAGNDLLEGNGGKDRFYAGSGNDIVTGGGSDDTVYGGDGNDLVSGGGGEDVLAGDDGDDVLLGSGDEDSLYGGAGNDALVGNGGRDLLFGGLGNDLLTGSGDKDTIYGGENDDLLVGSGGNDRLFGGDGTDAAVYGHNRNHYSIVTGSGGDVTIIHGGEKDVLTGVEFARFADQTVALGGSGNNAPDAVNDSASLGEDAASVTGNVLTNDTDVDSGDSKTVTNPGTYALAHGTLVLAANGAYTFTPSASAQTLGQGQSVIDSFSYTMQDSQGATDSAQLAVTINGANDGPTAVNDAASVGENAANVTGNVLGNDTDIDSGDSKTVTNPGTYSLAHGTLVLAANGNYTFSPGAAAQTLAQGESVVDSFNYTMQDGAGAASGAQLAITINGANDGPVAVNDAASVSEDAASVTGNVLGNDTDADSGDSKIVANPGTYSLAHGTLVLAGNGDYTFSPSAAAQTLGQGQNAVNTFSYTMQDSLGASSGAQLAVTITGSNDGPVAIADQGFGTENSPLLLNVVGNDTDIDAGDTRTLVAVGTPVGGGTASIQGNQLRYDPGTTFQHLADGATAQVSVSYTIADSQGAQSVSVANIEVAGTNDAPVAVADGAAGTENQALVIDVLANDTDVDDGHSFSLLSAATPPGKGTLSIVDDKLQFNPGTSFDHLGAGVQEVVVASYTMADEYGAPSTANLTLTITGTNDAPVVSAVSRSTTEDAAATATLSISDIDGGDILSYSLDISGGHHGMLTDLGNGSVSFTPDANWSGSDTFTYTASDNHGGTSSSANIVFNVAAVADTPNLSLAAPSASADAGQPIALGISASLVDADGSETLTVEISGLTAAWQLSAGTFKDDTGVWVVNAGDLSTLTATPPAGAVGNFNISVRAVSRELSNGDSAQSAAQSLQLQSGTTGTAIDGYMSGATVFTDANDNGVIDGSEIYAVTDQYGRFTLSGTPPANYHLVMFGGTDVATGQAFTGTLTAPAGSTVVTPITTLMTALIESGAATNAADAQTLVTSALGLPTGVNLATFDPVQAALSGDPVASAAGQHLYAAGVQVANTIALVTSVVSGAGATAADAVAAAIEQFASQIENATGELNLTGAGDDTSALQDLISGAASVAGQAVSAAVVEGIASVVAGSNSVVETALAQADAVDVLTVVTQAAVVAQGDASAAAQNAGATNDASAAVAGYTGTALEDAVEAAEVEQIIQPLLGTAGDDTIVGTDRGEEILGEGGVDQLFGGAGNDTLVGGAGNDNYVGGAGDDILDGGAVVQFVQASDFINVDRAEYSDAGSAVTVDLSASLAWGVASGTDTLIGMEGVFGTDFDDVLLGDDNFSEFFRGGAGNDLIYGNGGYDRAIYSNATSAISVDLTGGVVVGDSSGTDTLRGVELVRGSTLSDIYNAVGYTSAFVPGASANSDDAFNGGNFNEFEGLAGDDTVIGNGATRLQYQNSASGITVNISAGTVFGLDSGLDTFSGVSGVNATSSSDTIFGGNGNEVFSGRGGNDTVYGGGGVDRIDYRNDGAGTIGLTVNLSAGTVVADPVISGTDTLRSVESVRGSMFDDTFVATGFSSISTNAGSNGAFNAFEGIAGNDTVIGNGQTQLTFGDARSGITVDMTGNSISGTVYFGGSGTVHGDLSVGDDTFSGVGNIQGGFFDDTILGSNNTVNSTEFYTGLSGDDYIDGRNGFDRVNLSNGSGGTLGATVDLASGVVTGGDDFVGNDILRGIEAVGGSNFDDTIIATGFSTLSTNAGWFGSFNELEGFAGNDTIVGNGSTRLTYQSNLAGQTSGVSLAYTSATGGTAFGTSTGSDAFSLLSQITGSNFNDTIDASLSTGVNSIAVNNGNDVVFGGNLNSTINSGNGTDTVYGGSGNDTVFADGGDSANDTLYGGGGNDALGTNAGFDLVYGGAGNDGLNAGNNSSSTFFGDDGNDNMGPSGSFNTLYGGTGNDNLNTSGNSSTLYGDGDNDNLFTTGSLSTLYGGSGNDNVNSNGNSLTIYGGSDNDFGGGNGHSLTVYGGSGNDALFANGNDERLFGEAGDDTLGGGFTNDTLDGGDGNDTLWGGTFVGPTGDDVFFLGGGDNQAHGFDGNDTFHSGEGTGTNAIDGGSGNDTVSYAAAGTGIAIALHAGTANGWGGTDNLLQFGGINNVEAVVGSNFNDFIDGDNNNNALFGGGADDTLHGLDGNDVLVAGSGNNTLVAGFDSWTDTFVLGGGNDFIVDMIAGIDRIVVKAGNLVASGFGTNKVTFTDGSTVEAANYTFFGTSDMYNPDGSQLGTLFNGTGIDDTMFGTNSNDLAYGAGGNDQLHTGLGNDTIYGGTENDFVAAGDGNDYVEGGDGLDNINGNAHSDTLYGGSGNDFITGHDDSDTIFGGNDNDNLNGNQQSDTVYGGIGNDNVNGNEDNDTLFGEDGTDNLFGGDGNDALFGGNGLTNQFENLNGEAGDDTLDGGAGNDFANYFGSTAAITANLVTSLATGLGTDTLINIEGLVGGSLGDTLTGDSLNNNLVGNAGNDVIFGGNGGDFIQGQAGDDTVYGGGLFDYAVYGSINDFDTMDFFLNGTIGNGPVSVNLAAHTAVISSGSFAGTDTIFNVEQVNGTNFADTLIGGGGARSENFQGRAGNDFISGDGIHQGRIILADLNYTAGLNNLGVTITISNAANGAGTVTDNLAPTVAGSVGTDTFQYINGFTATKYNDVFYGGSYNFRPADPTFTSTPSSYQGNGGSDTVIGNGQSNIAYGDVNSTLAGGAGVIVNFAAGTVQHGASSSGGLAGTDVVSGIRFASGTNFSDTFYGGGTAPLSMEFEGFGGSQGNDTVFGGSGFDEVQFADSNVLVTSGVTINMNAGVDINGSYGTAFSSAYFGTDRFYSVESAAGSLLDDLYIATGFTGGNAESSTFDGWFPSATFNRFSGRAGNDTVIGNGDTQLEYRSSAEAGIVARFTGHQSGTVMGDASVGTDTFSGVYGIRDTNYADTFYGSDANANTADDMELFRLAGGNDTVYGGLGFDIVTYSDQYSGVTIDMSAGTATGATEGLDRFYGIEGVSGSRTDDTIVGDALDNLIAGNMGNDSLDGGGGSDVVNYYNAPTGVTVDLGSGTATGDGYGTTDQLANFERVTGSRYADTLTGSSGNDTLNGADGDDVLTGGAGADLFVFRPPLHTSATVPPGNGHDTITDFTVGEDLIDLRADLFSGGIAEVLSSLTQDGLGNAIVNMRAATPCCFRASVRSTSARLTSRCTDCK